MPKNVKNTTFPGLLDLLAPHSCRGCGRIGTPLCDRCKKYLISEHSSYQPDLPSDFLDLILKSDLPKNSRENSPKTNFPPIFVLGPRAGLVGKMVHDLKFHSARALAHSLAELLDETLPDYKGKVSIVPLPTNPKHIRARGLDHTLLIAKHLARLRDYKVERLLLRAKNTTQVGASESDRLRQAAEAYELKSGAKLDPKTTYLLLDDVWTTGASMKSAYKLFQTLNPSKTHLILLARN